MSTEDETIEKQYTGPFIPETLLVDWADTPLNADMPLHFQDLRVSGVPSNIRDVIGDLYSALNFSMFNEEMPECEFEFAPTQEANVELEHRGAVHVLKINPEFIQSACMADLLGELILQMSVLNAAIGYPIGYADELKNKDTPSRSEFRRCRDEVPKILGLSRTLAGSLFPYKPAPREVGIPCEHIGRDLFDPSPHPDRGDDETCKLNCAELIYAGKQYYEFDQEFKKHFLRDYDKISPRSPPQYGMGPFIPRDLMVQWSTEPYNPERPVDHIHAGVPRNMPHRMDDVFAALKFALFDDNLPDVEVRIIERDYFEPHTNMEDNGINVYLTDRLFQLGTPFGVVATLAQALCIVEACMKDPDIGVPILKGESSAPQWMVDEWSAKGGFLGANCWNCNTGTVHSTVRMMAIARVTLNIMGDEQFDLLADRETCRAGCDLMLSTLREGQHNSS